MGAPCSILKPITASADLQQHDSFGAPTVTSKHHQLPAPCCPGAHALSRHPNNTQTLAWPPGINTECGLRLCICLTNQAQEGGVHLQRCQAQAPVSCTALEFAQQGPPDLLR
jgi:hypothetical protein